MALIGAMGDGVDVVDRPSLARTLVPQRLSDRPSPDHSRGNLEALRYM
jgi:hypothetical protein